jgi:DNA-directed RNA polymerase specialized sigma24 family protein
MATWQENTAQPWPRRRRSSPAPDHMSLPECDVDKARCGNGGRAEDAEAVLAPLASGVGPGAADRLLGDALVIDAILEEGLGGPRHRMLEEALIGYAVPVLRHLLGTGRIAGRAAHLRRPLGDRDGWLNFTEADREEFARDMTADALPVFTRAVFETRCWSPSYKASLKTYFVNACILEFPRLYRQWARHRRAQPVGLDVDLISVPELDPAVEVALRDEVRRLLLQIKDPQVREILILRGAGYSAEDAARQAGLTVKAAEGRLARVRKGLRNQRDSAEPPNGQSGTSQGGR